MDINTTINNITNSSTLSLLGLMWEVFEDSRDRETDSLLAYAELLGLDYEQVESRLEQVTNATNARFNRLVDEIQELVSIGVLP